MPLEMFNSAYPDAVALVDVSLGRQGRYETKLAVCPEIFTPQWKSEFRLMKRIGVVDKQEQQDELANKLLWNCLGLP